MTVKPIEPGTKFGRLTVIRAAGQDPNTSKALSECICSCGAVVVKRNNDLKTGRVVSCGCAKRERSSKQMYERAEKSNAHHMSGTPIYQCWHDMMRRCYKQTRSSSRYRDRGIVVCEAWHKFVVFQKWAEEHGFDPDLEIDRIDYDKGYYPENCRFVDLVTQANNRSNNRLISYEGRTMTVAQWSRELGVPYHTIKEFTKKGGSIGRYINKTVRLADSIDSPADVNFTKRESISIGRSYRERKDGTSSSDGKKSSDAYFDCLPKDSGYTMEIHDQENGGR